MSAPGHFQRLAAAKRVKQAQRREPMPDGAVDALFAALSYAMREHGSDSAEYAQAKAAFRDAAAARRARSPSLAEGIADVEAREMMAAADAYVAGIDADKLLADIVARERAQGLEPRLPGGLGPAAGTDALARAAAHASRLPASVEGHGGDAALWHAAQEMAKLGLSEDDAVVVLMEKFVPRCTQAGAPWTDREVRHKAHRAVQEQAKLWEMYPPARARALAVAEVLPLTSADAHYTPAIGGEPVDPDDDLRAFCEPHARFLGELPYVCRSLGVVAGKVNGVDAKASAGKGPIVLSYSVHAAAGRSWCGHAFEAPVATLILPFEDGYVWSRRFERMCRAMGLNPDELPLEIRRARQGLAANGFIDSVGEYCERMRERFGLERVQVIIDSLSSANRGGARQNDAEYAELLWKLGDMSEIRELAAMMLAHDNKAGERGLDGIAGTQQIAAAFQTCWQIIKPAEHQAVVSCTRAPEESFPEFRVRIVDVPAPDGTPVPDELPAGLTPEQWRARWGLMVRPETTGETASGGLAARPQCTKQAAEAERKTKDALPRIWAHLKNEAGPYGASMRTLKQVGGEGIGAAERAAARLVEHGAVGRTAGGHYVALNPETATLRLLGCW